MNLNSIIWTLVPKTIFVSLETLKFRVYNVVSCFNAGNITKCQVLTKISITPGHYCVKSMKYFEKERVRDRERKLLICHKMTKKEI